MALKFFSLEAQEALDLAKRVVGEEGELTVGVLMAATYKVGAMSEEFPQLSPYLPEPKTRRRKVPDAVEVAENLRPVLETLSRDDFVTVDELMAALLESAAGRDHLIGEGLTLSELERAVGVGGSERTGGGVAWGSGVAPERRVIRVFVSSTFRDMAAERDELVKHVFPQLRKLCDERGVVWGEVDLRWGITDEQSAEGEVLPICLAEIDRTRPYFIGLVGERYGWVPDEVPSGLLEDAPWLQEHLDRSVTEMEILHGVLHNPEMAEHAFFYLRDPAYVDTLPEGVRDSFRETDEGLAGKLEGLKQRIRESGFPVREDYRDPEALGGLVLADLTALIDGLFPPGTALAPLDREAAEHEAFARSRAGVYVGGQGYFERLDNHAGGEGPPLVVVGESGSGKSALLANWAVKWRALHPDDLVVTHFIGGTPHSSDWAAMLRRIMGELARRFGIDAEIPDQPDPLRLAFAGLLHMAAARGRVVLILDALDQLEGRQGALDLVWLPPEIPASVRLIVSSLPGRSLDELKGRQWPALEVEPLEPGERRELIAVFLGQYTKQLSADRVERIASAPEAANPLYLRALLEELRVFGDHEQLDERINHYLAADSAVDLYERILERYENDYERNRPGLVTDAMSLIWAARRGLSETELLDLLGEGGEPLPSAFWSPLHLAAEQSLVDRGGLIGFFHDYLRQAVHDKYLPTADEQQATHLRLADYLDPMRFSDRGVDELPWQLAEAGAWQRIYDLLTDLEFLQRAWDTDQYEVKASWAKIEQASPLRLVDAYQSVIQEPDQHTAHIRIVATLLNDMGHPQEALGLNSYLVEHYRQTDDKENLQASLGNQAVILQTRGALDAAMALHKEEERICRELNNQNGLQRSLGSQAAIFHVRRELEAAMTLLKEQERICRELGDQDGLQVSLGNQALILETRDELNAAMTLHKESERICRQLGNQDNLAVSLGSQAVILQAWGKLDEAMTLHKESERICRQLGNKDGLQVSLGNQATILQAWGKLDEAMTLHKEKERICRQLGNKDSLSISLENQALILQGRGELDEAMTLLREVEETCRQLGNQDSLQASLGSQAAIFRVRRELDAAMTLHRETERICRQLGNQDGLQASLGRQASILRARGDLDEAMTLLKEKERICRQLGNQVDLAVSLGNQAAILQSRGDLDVAMMLHKETEAICRQLDNPDSLAYSLANQAVFLADSMGRPREALPLAEEALRLATEHGLTALAEQIAPIVDRVRLRL